MLNAAFLSFMQMHTRTCYLHCSTFLWEIAKSCAGWQLDASACTSSNSLDLRGARNADRKLRRPHAHAISGKRR